MVRRLAERNTIAWWPRGSPPAQIEEIIAHLEGFLALGLAVHSRFGLAPGDPSFVREAKFRDRYVALVDSLRRIAAGPAVVVADRPSSQAIDIVGRCLLELARRWGWESLIAPGSEREHFLKKQETWFREKLERPYYDAALSWSAAFTSQEVVDDKNKEAIQRVAEEGLRKGFRPSMSPAEGEQSYKGNRGNPYSLPRYGLTKPQSR